MADPLLRPGQTHATFQRNFLQHTKMLHLTIFRLFRSNTIQHLGTCCYRVAKARLTRCQDIGLKCCVRLAGPQLYTAPARIISRCFLYLLNGLAVFNL